MLRIENNKPQLLTMASSGAAAVAVSSDPIGIGASNDTKSNSISVCSLAVVDFSHSC
jgi:hypothetical protein